MKQSRLIKSATSTATATQVMPKALVGKTLTEESLTLELTSIEKTMAELTDKLERTNQEGNIEDDKEVDELSAYMKANERLKAQEEVKWV